MRGVRKPTHGCAILSRSASADRSFTFRRGVLACTAP